MVVPVIIASGPDDDTPTHGPYPEAARTYLGQPGLNKPHVYEIIIAAKRVKAFRARSAGIAPTMCKHA